MLYRPMERSPVLRRGATAVEFALVAPVFFMFILGLIELGRGMMVQSLLENAARAGVRTGIVEGTSTSQITSTVTNMLSSQGISGDTATIEVNDNVADASTAQAGDEITVLVSVPVSQITWVPVPTFLHGTISAQYTMRRE